MTSQVAIVFPGQGSQYVGMGRELHDAGGIARACFDEAAEVLGASFVQLLFDGPEQTLRLTANAQPAILLVSVAAYRHAQAHTQMAAAAFAGHSLGEFSALVAAGALSLGDALRLVRSRGIAMQRAVPEGEGAMAAVLGLDAAAVVSECEVLQRQNCLVTPANFNEPMQTVIAGRTPDVERAAVALKLRGAKRVVPLPVSAPFHCSMMAPAAQALSEAMSPLSWSALRVPVWSNVTAQPHVAGAPVSERMIEQVTSPVNWVGCVLGMREAGISVFWELGPGKVLTGLNRRIAGDVTCFSAQTPDEIMKTAAEITALGPKA